MLGAIIFGIALIGLLISNARYEKAKKGKPSPMVCPNCHSQNIKLRKEISNITGTRLSSYGNRTGVHSSVHTINRQRIGVCQNCGYDYPFTSKADVSQALKSAKSSFYVWLVLTIIAAGIGVWMFLH